MITDRDTIQQIYETVITGQIAVLGDDIDKAATSAANICSSIGDILDVDVETGHQLYREALVESLAKFTDDMTKEQIKNELDQQLQELKQKGGDQ